MRKQACKRGGRTDQIVMLLALMISGGVFNLYQNYLIGATFAVLSLLIYRFIVCPRVSDRNIAISSVVILILVSLYMVKILFSYEDQSMLKYGLVLLNVLIALMFLLYYQMEKMLLQETLYIVLKLLLYQAVVSFIAWFVIEDYLQYSDKVKGKTFYYLLFYPSFSTGDMSNYMVNVLGLSFPRTRGVFWEPGILQFYMNILFNISTFIKNDKKISILSALVIISTWSSTGLAILGCQIAYYIYLHIRKGTMVRVIVAMPVAVLFLFPMVLDNLDDKLHGKHAGSGYSRVLDTITAIRIIEKNPLLGITLDSENYRSTLKKSTANIDMEGKSRFREASNTNSMLNYMVFFGIPIGLLIWISFYKQTIITGPNPLIFLIMILSLSSEPIGLFVIPLVVMLSAYITQSKSQTRCNSN